MLRVMRKTFLFLSVLGLLGFASPALTASAEPEYSEDGDFSYDETISAGESLKIEENNWDSISVEREGVSFRSAGTLAPACVNAVAEKGFVQVYNNCGFDVRVKVAFAYVPDTSCHLVVDGTRHNISTARGRIDRVELC